MARTPSVRYFESRKAYYTTWKGKQYPLAQGPKDEPSGETYLKAVDAYKSLMASANLVNAGDNNTAKAICNAYIAAKQGKLRQKTLDIKIRALKTFVDRYGDLPASEVKASHAELVISEMRQPRRIGKRIYRWNDAMEIIFTRQLKAAFSWATKNELISRNPMAALEVPEAYSLSRERVINEDEYQKVLSVLRTRKSGAIRNLIVCLENTGARPSELTSAKVSDYDAVNGAIVYHADATRRKGEHAHKTSRRKTRKIYFTGEARGIVDSLIAGKKSFEHIFQTRKGGVYDTKMLGLIVRGIRRRAGVPQFVPYSFRHKLATEWLTAGKSIDTLAAILGNTPQTIRLHYSHLLADDKAIREQIEVFRRETQAK